MSEKLHTWLAAPQADAPCTVIAEVAQAHDGSLGTAHAYIDAAARAGADAIKFQTHIASAESTPHEPWRVKFSAQDETRYDYWQRMEFTPEQWAGLKRHADDAGLLFLSSAFSLEAVELLKTVGVAGWKVASGEITNIEMLSAMAATGQPVLVSTGMSDFAEIGVAVEVVREHDAPLCVFQCTTQYPSPPEAIGLNVLGELRDRFGCAVGLSDHSGTIFPGLAAASLGVEAIEVHIALSRDAFGPDVVASLTPAEMAQLVSGVRFIETMNAHPADKTSVPGSVLENRKIFLKSVVASGDLAAGTVLERRHLAAKKPGTGVPAAKLADFVGRTLARDVSRDQLLQFEDLKA
ncbi:MAG: N-acetylneuraminate synthase family protein [Hyphomicrobiales bacterium]|nr:N-acetylneuraminate synthase family protein [Hyphomicrobiales bacterium]